MDVDEQNSIGSKEKQHECSICKKLFSTTSRLKEHLRTHTGEKPYVCTECSKGFPSKSNLRKHFRMHTGEKPYKCVVCSKSFAFNRCLKIHARTHTGERPYVCDICQKSFAQSDSLKEHYHVHTGEKPYECDVCHKKFARRACLNSHALIHSGVKPFVCSICQKSFQTKYHLNCHFNRHSEKRTFQCTSCPKSYNEVSDLIRHSKTHDKPYVCDLCKKSFSFRYRLTEHIRDVHKEGLLYKCSECGREYKTEKSLNVHRRFHTGERLHTCNICGKLFVHMGAFNIHLKTHNEISYKCNMCVSEFLTEKDLNTHKLVHNPDKPYKCNQCDKTFLTGKSLNIHKVVHHKAKPCENVHQEKAYKCNKCEKEFLNEKSFKIHICENQYHHNLHPIQDTRKHFKTIHLEKSYKCNKCEREFLTQEMLNMHYLIHTRDSNNFNMYQNNFSMEVPLNNHMNIQKNERTFFRDINSTGLFHSINNQDNYANLYVSNKCQSSFSNEHSFQEPIETKPQINSSEFLSEGLQPQLLIHTGDDSNNSNVCQSSFSNEHSFQEPIEIQPQVNSSEISSGGLQPQHLIHTGENSNNSNMCQKQISLQQPMTSHINNHNADKPLHGEQCPKSSFQLTHLMDNLDDYTKLYACNLCESSFTNDLSLKEHLETEHQVQSSNSENELSAGKCLNTNRPIHTEEKLYTSNVCQKGLSLENFLSELHKIHTGKNNHKIYTLHKCHLCDKLYATKMHLDMHICFPTVEKNSICKRKSLNKRNSDQHLQNITDEETNVLNNCNQVFSDSRKFKDTHRHTHRLESYNCEKCNERFPLKSIFINHIRNHFEMNENGFMCNICNTLFKQDNLLNHLRLHTSVKSFTCDKCEKTFCSKWQMTEHHLQHDVEKPYACSDCDRKFSWEKTLKCHRFVHHNDTQCGCDKNKHLLKNTEETSYKKRVSHLKATKSKNFGNQIQSVGLIATEEKTYSGDKYQKIYSAKSTLNNPLKLNLIPHLQQHNKEHPCECHYCHKKYTDAHNWKKHCLLHRQKPFSCGTCQKRFLHKSSLAIHFLNHVHGNVHECNICKKSFSQKCTLICHLRFHTGKKLFKCGKCGKQFFYGRSLAEHLKGHSGGKSYACNKCHKSFSLKESLSEHICSGDSNTKKHVLSIQKASLGRCSCPTNCIFKLNIFPSEN